MSWRVYGLTLLGAMGTSACTINYSVELIQANADRGADTEDVVDDNDSTSASAQNDAALKIPAL